MTPECDVFLLNIVVDLNLLHRCVSLCVCMLYDIEDFVSVASISLFISPPSFTSCVSLLYLFLCVCLCHLLPSLSMWYLSACIRKELRTMFLWAKEVVKLRGSECQGEKDATWKAYRRRKSYQDEGLTAIRAGHGKESKGALKVIPQFCDVQLKCSVSDFVKRKEVW